MKNYQTINPEGFKDYIGEEMSIKKKIESQLEKLLIDFNYELIEIPTVEYIDVTSADKLTKQNMEVFTLINRQGEILSLRNDMTKSIARVVLSNQFEYPKRLCYLNNVFRYPNRYEGKLHEFTQVGAELIGVNNLKADVEIVSLAVKTLATTLVDNFSLHLGSSAFFEGLIAELGIQNLREIIYDAINQNDVVNLKKQLVNMNIEEQKIDLLFKLLFAVGKIELLSEVKASVKSKAAIEAIEYMESIYKALDEQKLTDNILFDFSLISHKNYYTGIRFEGFTKGVGRSVLTGGRYNDLIGEGIPAVGFGININDLIKRITIEDNQSAYVYYNEKESLSEQMVVVNRIREKGYRIELSLFDSFEETKKYAEKTNKIVVEGEKL